MDGPGFIRHVANGISSGNANIENKPNIGNLITGFSKMLSGRPLTNNESDAMIYSIKDEKVLGQFKEIFNV